MFRVSGVFSRSLVPLDASAICVFPETCRPSGRCTCGFSAYRTRLEALRHRSPTAPLVTVIGRDHVRDPFGAFHPLFRHQQVLKVEIPAVCVRCLASAHALAVCPDSTAADHRKHLVASCGQCSDGDLWTAADATRRAGIEVTLLSDDLSRYLAAQERVLPRRAPSPGSRCWCRHTQTLTWKGGYRLYVTLGLLHCGTGTFCAACGTEWTRTHVGMVACRRPEGVRDS